MSFLIRHIFLLLLLTATAYAQPYYFRHYQVESGLSNNSVYCSIQDKNGFLWFGTKDGLNRFDGYRFKLFNIVANNESSLSNDLITSLALDDKGALWVGSEKGLYQFDALNERLIPFIDTLHYISDILIDKSGRLWFISNRTLCRFDFRTMKLKIFSPLIYFPASSICQTEDGTLWFSTADGFLQRYNDVTGAFTGYSLFSHSPPVGSLLIEKILPGNEGTLLIGTSSQGIKQFDIVTASYRDLLMFNPDKTKIYVRDILKVTPDEYWFATESGIFIMNPGTGKFTNLRKKYLDPYSLSDNAVYCLYKDLEGGIWAGTFFGGINYFAKQYSIFQKYFPDYSKNSISGSVVREICEDTNGNLWIGTEDAGLNKLNPRTGVLTHYEPTGASNSISYTNIHGLLVVGSDLWVGTYQHGLDILDTRTGKNKKHFSAGPGKYDFKSNFIVCLLQTKNGNIYAGTSKSLYRYNATADGFIPPDEVPQDIFVSCLLEDHSGTVWVGTHNNGIYYFNPYTKEKGHLTNDPKDKNSLTTNTINALYEDRFHNLWFSTEGGGLCQLDKSKKKLSRFTTKNGLPSNFVFKVLEDNNGSLWVTTSKGLVNLNSHDGTTIIYSKENGLLNDQFNYNSGYKDATGKLYFGSVRGMIMFNPADYKKSNFTPPIYFTGFQVNNKEVEINKANSFLKQSILFTDRITLPHDQSSFSIDFAALSFPSSKETVYRYVMKGLDKEWTYIKSNRKVYFTNLKPGTYTFKVQAASNGTWNTGEKQLIINVLPPLWATRWAQLLYLVLGIVFLSYLIHSYHNMLEAKKEKELYKAKIDLFTNIAHEIKTPLTLIKGPVENLNDLVKEVPQIKEDVATMERNTNRLINLTNQILDFRQIEAKRFSLDFSEVDIVEILQEAYLMFDPVAKKRKLDYSIHLPGISISTMADAEALNKIFSNLLSNAVKYADREVNIKLCLPKEEDNFLLIEIRNDGFLIPDELKEKIFEPFYRLKESRKQQGTGIGLALARSLVELHKGQLYVKEAENGMNVFIITIPYFPYQNRRKINSKTGLGLPQQNKS